jgi:hypothetical protein
MCWLWENADRLSGVGAILAFIVAVFALGAQRKHNRLSVRPLASVTCNDVDDKIIVTLANNGTGPLLVNTLRVIRDGKVIGDALHKQLPTWMTFRWYVGVIDGRSIAVGKSIDLLIFDDPSVQFQEDVRSTLSNLDIQVSYSDIYNYMQPVYVRSLGWLGEKRQRKG